MLSRFSHSLCRNRKIGLKFSKHKLSIEASTREFKEVEIKVPWGKIAGKLWGPSDIQPIIALHGWQDNAGSFDPLAMHLPKDISLLAIDFPGHGKSSWLPNGIMYSPMQCVQTIHRIKEHFGMDKISLMGHSMGGIMTFQYTSLFPDNVKFVVAFDFFKPPALNEQKQYKWFRQHWNDYFKYEKLITSLPPTYTEDEVIKRWIKATNNSIDETSCRILMKRGTTIASDGKIFFNRDPRVKSLIVDGGITNDHIKILAKQIHCPYMVFKAEDSDYNEKKENYFEIVQLFKESLKDFRFYMVPGTHHFHMRTPSVVGELMMPFIHQYSN